MSTTTKPITGELARTRHCRDVRLIAREALEVVGLGDIGLGSRSRTKSLVRRRTLAVWMCRADGYARSFPEIARAFCFKNHSTVVSACKRARLWPGVNGDSATERLLLTLERRLSGDDATLTDQEVDEAWESVRVGGGDGRDRVTKGVHETPSSGQSSRTTTVQEDDT